MAFVQAMADLVVTERNDDFSVDADYVVAREHSREIGRTVVRDALDVLSAALTVGVHVEAVAVGPAVHGE